jgi:hypothetical protein
MAKFSHLSFSFLIKILFKIERKARLKSRNGQVFATLIHFHVKNVFYEKVFLGNLILPRSIMTKKGQL